jgi:hypothetical protein
MDRDRERSLNARIARSARATEDPYLMTSAARAARLERLRAQVTAENPALLEDEVERAVELLIRAHMARMSKLRWAGKQAKPPGKGHKRG